MYKYFLETSYSETIETGHIPNRIITPMFDTLQELVEYANQHDIKIGGTPDMWKYTHIIKEDREILGSPEITDLFKSYCLDSSKESYTKSFNDLRKGDTIYVVNKLNNKQIGFDVIVSWYEKYNYLIFRTGNNCYLIPKFNRFDTTFVNDNQILSSDLDSLTQVLREKKLIK